MAKRVSKNSPIHLPQLEEIWLVVLHEMRVWITPPDEEPYRPWLLAVLNGSTGAMLLMEVLEKEPTAVKAKRLLYRTMRKHEPSADHEPHRPTGILFDAPDLYEELADDLMQIEIQTAAEPRPDEVDQMLADLEANMRGRPEHPSLLSQTGATVELVGGFFAAAADYYRAEPWLTLTDRNPLSIDVPASGLKFICIVMGNAGIEYGLALYQEWTDVENVFLPTDQPLSAIPERGARSLSFETIAAVPFEELEDIERQDWEIADKDAYPILIVFTPPDKVERPEAPEIFWYQAALRAIPLMLEEHLQVNELGDFDPVDIILSVDTSQGPTDVHVTYPAGVLPEREEMAVDSFDWSEGGDDESWAFDRRSMEGAMAQMFGHEDETPLTQAQALMYEAWETQDPGRRIILAHEALELSPDCADAYVLLAEEAADTRKQALSYYEQGVAAGERALGPEAFKEDVGHFWGLIETRPYMRARQGLANTLWSLGRKDEAKEHYREMLHLNPGDNQGIRYTLLNLLLEIKKDEEAQELLDEYDDGMAEWLYTHALLAFRRKGENRQTNRLLKSALSMNPHVPAFLTGKTKLPAYQPPYIGYGDESEAINYASSYLRHWRQTPGAISWLKKQNKDK